MAALSERALRLAPRTTLGRWAVGLVAAVPLLVFLGATLSMSLYASVPAGQTIGADVAARPALALAMLAGMAAGIAAFGAGVVAIARQKDHAVLVYLSTLIGGLLTLFLVAEVAFAH